MKIGILGTGVYGIALARVAFINGNEVTMWTKFEEEKNYLSQNRFSKNMSDIILDKKINITCDLDNTLKSSDLIIIAIPSDFVYDLLKDIKDTSIDKIICIASKGIDPNNNMFISDIAFSLGMNNIGFISGPTFAHEMANYESCGLTIASSNEITKNAIYNAFKNEKIKLEFTNDIIGIQLSSTLKNIFAIVMGMLDGKNYSSSSKALVITSLINELNNAIKEKNNNSNIITSLAGIGDIWLTCTSTQSRNYTLGTIIATNDKDKIKEFLNNNTVEGYDNLNIILKLKDVYNFKLPLIEHVYNIVNGNETIDNLLNLITK